MRHGWRSACQLRLAGCTNVVSFSTYTRAEVPRISDHPLVAANVTLDLTDGVTRD